jgi:hypothetical protein
MEINTNEKGEMEFTKVDKPIKLIVDKGEEMIISMRDGGFEVAYGDYVLSFKKGSMHFMSGGEDDD